MGIALSQSERKLYWTDCSLGTISRASLGSGPEVLVSGLAGPRAIALDEAGGTMYWSETGAVRRANLDGSRVDDRRLDLVRAGDRARRCCREAVLGDGGAIRRANLDGSGVETIVTNLNTIGIAVDPDEGKLYWTETESGKIQRANLDGSSVEDLVGGLDTQGTRPPPGRELPAAASAKRRLRLRDRDRLAPLR